MADLGLGDVAIYLVDLDQRLLVPLGPSESTRPERLEIDSTPAGAGAATAGQRPAEVLRRLCHAILDHQQGQLQDDATLLLVAYTGPG